jgi:hypothetical protein
MSVRETYTSWAVTYDSVEDPVRDLDHKLDGKYDRYKIIR